MEESTRVKMDCNQTENKESIIANAQKFMQDGCGCRRGLKSSQCFDQLTEETVLDNLLQLPGTVISQLFHSSYTTNFS